MKSIIVAIDGYSGCGKSSTAKGVARALDFTYIDSGAMYRASTLFFIRREISPDEEEKIASLVSEIQIDFGRDDHGNSITFLNGENVEDSIRTMKVSNMVSQYSKLPVLRQAMVTQQRKLSRDKNVVMDGRDIGTVVFPDADLKLFMTAELRIRAKRRQKELAMNGISEELSAIEVNLEERDQIDTNRDTSPLIKAKDAIEIDTTYLTLEDQILQVIQMVKDRMTKSV